MDNENNGAAGVASNMIWALAFIIVVGMIVAGLYYGGILSGKTKKEIDVNVSIPTR